MEKWVGEVVPLISPSSHMHISFSLVGGEICGKVSGRDGSSFHLTHLFFFSG